MLRPEDSVAGWIEGLKSGDSVAAFRLYGDVYGQLVRLARGRLNGVKLKWADEEDVALSVFKSFCLRAAAGQFPEVNNRGDLWKLLVKIVARKVRDYVRHDRRKKRSAAGAAGDTALDPRADEGSAKLHSIASSELAADMELLVAEESQRLLDSLKNETLAQVAVWKMEGYSNAEIAARLGCVERTVERKLERIREKWCKCV